MTLGRAPAVALRTGRHLARQRAPHGLAGRPRGGVLSFGAGTRESSRRIPLYAAGRIFTARLVPRTRDEWVFGCGCRHRRRRALALWGVAAAERAHARCGWSARSGRRRMPRPAASVPSEALAAGLVAHRARPRGRGHPRLRRREQLRRVGRVRRAAVARHPAQAHRARLSRDASAVPGARGSAACPGATARVTIAAAASCTPRRRPAHPESCPRHPISCGAAWNRRSPCAIADVPVIGGEPRVDALSQGTADRPPRRAARATSDAWSAVDAGRALVLYAPTWRDGAPDPAVP